MLECIEILFIRENGKNRYIIWIIWSNLSSTLCYFVWTFRGRMNAFRYVINKIFHTASAYYVMYRKEIVLECILLEIKEENF